MAWSRGKLTTNSNKQAFGGALFMACVGTMWWRSCFFRFRAEGAFCLGVGYLSTGCHLIALCRLYAALGVQRSGTLLARGSEMKVRLCLERGSRLKT